jgi:hypothetical protein
LNNERRVEGRYSFSGDVREAASSLSTEAMPHLREVFTLQAMAGNQVFLSRFDEVVKDLFEIDESALILAALMGEAGDVTKDLKKAASDIENSLTDEDVDRFMAAAMRGDAIAAKALYFVARIERNDVGRRAKALLDANSDALVAAVTQEAFRGSVAASDLMCEIVSERKVGHEQARKLLEEGKYPTTTVGRVVEDIESCGLLSLMWLLGCYKSRSLYDEQNAFWNDAAFGLKDLLLEGRLLDIVSAKVGEGDSRAIEMLHWLATQPDESILYVVLSRLKVNKETFDGRVRAIWESLSVASFEAFTRRLGYIMLQVAS